MRHQLTKRISLSWFISNVLCVFVCFRVTNLISNLFAEQYSYCKVEKKSLILY